MRMAAIMVPGIMGTRLVLPGAATGGKDEEVWPPTPKETQLGYGRMGKLADPRLVPTEPIDQVLCFPFYGTLRTLLEDMGFSRVNGNRLLVEFPYDWRRDNFDTAQRLAAKLDALHADGIRRFFLLGHSMGGLVCRLMLESGAYDQRPWFINIRLFAALASPHLGAPLALARIFGLDTAVGVSGADFAKFARNRDYPSGYQLIPAPGEQAVWNLASRDLEPLDVYDEATAIKLGMDPVLVERAAAMHAVLAKGRRPGQVRYFYVAGTGHKTVTRVNVRFTGAAVNHAHSAVTTTTDAGDGTVPLYSALPAVGQRQIVVNEHATVFAGEPFRRVLHRLLGADAGPPLEAPDAAAGPMLGLTLDNPVQKRGAPVELTMSVGGPGVGPDGAAGVAAIRGELILDAMSDRGRPLRGARRRVRVRYEGPAIPRLTLTLDAIAEPGLYRLRWKGEPPAEAPAPFAVGPAA
jgi:pimeloyl-ACP methyl ester carboxylesterase